MILFVEYWSLSLLLLSVLITGLSPGDIGQATTPPSGCELCASTGDCSTAFRNGPGQFCGNWMDRSNHEVPCCCPMKAVCNVAPADFVCTCAYVGAMPPYHSESDLMNKVLWLWWVIGVAVIVIVCGACGYFVVKRLTNRDSETCAFAAPEVIVPLVSPTREALYGSIGQTRDSTFTPETAGSGTDQVSEVPERTARVSLGAIPGLTEEAALPTHDVLDVGGDGFDGGLGDEAESSEDDVVDEEIALLTVTTKDTTTS